MLVKKSINHLLYALVLSAQLVVAVAVIVTPAQAQSPVGYWTFNDRNGSGIEAADSSGYSHTAALVNGVSWVTGQAGGAVAADAASRQYVSIPAIDLSSTQAVTVALWVNRTYSTAGGHVLFEASADYSQSTSGFIFLPDDDTCHGIQAAVRGNGGYTANCYSQPSSGAWHHLAVVFDKRQTAGDAVKFYLDGVLQTPSQSLFASTNTDNFGNNPIYLFSRGGEMMFDSGALDDFLIYNTALTAAQIQQIYQGTTLLALAVTPANASIPAGTWQQFTATGTYGNGSQQDLTSLVKWSSSASSVAAINSGGLATGVATGSTTIQATLGSISGRAGATVRTTVDLADSSTEGGWQQGFDFRNTQNFAVDPPGSTYVLSSTVYPTTVGGATFGWVNSSSVGARELNAAVDARLAGINYANNRQPATFYVDLPAPGTYNLALAMGGAGPSVCLQGCQVQFRDGSTVLATVRERFIGAGHFYDAMGNNWSAAAWPTSNVPRQVTLTGTRLTVVVGTNQASGDFTPLSYLGLTQPPSMGNFTISAVPSSLSVVQGNQGTAAITTTINTGFKSAISLSASGMPTGTTVSFNPNPIAAPGAGNSSMTITVGSSTPAGTYPITVTGNGGGIQHNTAVTLTVIAAPTFTLSASPSSLSEVQGNLGTSTITTTINNGFNSVIRLSASGMPSGTTVSFNPPMIPSPGNGHSAMMIRVGSNTPIGTYPITVTGTGGGIQQNTAVTLTVITQQRQQQAPPNGMIGYDINNTSVPPSIQAAFVAWLWRNYQMVVGPDGVDLTSGRNAWPTYVDGCCIYGKDIYTGVLATAAAQGWPDPEGPLLHMNIDYQPSPIYSGIDQFDAYEQIDSQTSGLPANAINGIFTLVGSTYTDVTVRAYCPATVPVDYWGTCLHYPANPVPVSDRLLIGYQTPFDTVNITLNTARSGGAVTWQYWNGSNFSSLALATDTTNGLTSTGTVTFLPPSNWVPHVVNGSQSKYWVQITVSGASTAPKLARVYGDNLLTGGYARGWNPSTCVAGHINIGTPLEYCGTPHSGSTAKFRQQARQLGYPGAYNDFYGNPINIQNGQNTWAYIEKVRTAAALGSYEMDGVMFDDGGCSPYVLKPSWSNTQTELGATTYLSAATTLFTAEHALLAGTYGSNPKWWDGLNACGSGSLITSMNWVLSENATQTVNSFDMDTGRTGYMCTDSTWCPGQSTSNNPNNAMQLAQIQDYTQFGLQDGNGNFLSDFHLWDMSQRGPMNALAEYYLMKNTNLWFGYNPAGFYYQQFDDYYYWVKSARTLSSGITASTCSKGCTINLSGALETSTCPGYETQACPIRIGGVDVVGTTSYSGTTLTTRTDLFGNAILNNYSAGATIEYAVMGHQSVDIPLHTPVFMYGAFIPASSINLGTPDSTYGYNKPCTSSSYWVDGGCIWMHGPAISGNSAACSSGGGLGFPLDKWCSPLLRRDFTGGTYGKAIVLLRPTTFKDNPTATTEYDTPSQTITLPGTYYQVMADGTVSSTPITTTKLRGGEAAIYVSRGQ